MKLRSFLLFQPPEADLCRNNMWSNQNSQVWRIQLLTVYEDHSIFCTFKLNPSNDCELCSFFGTGGLEQCRRGISSHFREIKVGGNLIFDKFVEHCNIVVQNVVFCNIFFTFCEVVICLAPFSVLLIWGSQVFTKKRLLEKEKKQANNMKRPCNDILENTS